MDFGKIRTWCPTCHDEMPADGPQGILVHVLSLHPTSDLAHRIVEELTYAGARVKS